MGINIFNFTRASRNNDLRCRRGFGGKISNMDKDLSRLIRSFLEHLEVEKNCSKLTVRNYQHYLQTFLDFVGGEKGGQPIIDDLDLDLIRRYRLFLSRKKGVDGEMRSVTQGYYIIALRKGRRK